jgi:hypothetical protein
MAWFNPPLNKRGNKRCPDCGKTQWGHLLNGWFMSEWHCSECQAVLGVDGWRYLLSGLARVAVYSAILLSIILLRPVPTWTFLAAFVAFVAMTALIAWWFDSVKLKSTTR